MCVGHKGKSVYSSTAMSGLLLVHRLTLSVVAIKVRRVKSVNTLRPNPHSESLVDDTDKRCLLPQRRPFARILKLDMPDDSFWFNTTASG